MGRNQRAKEEEELKRLKEKQAKRKEIRAEQDKKLAAEKKQEEDRLKKEAAEKKAAEEEKKKQEMLEAEIKRQEMMAAQKEKGGSKQSAPALDARRHDFYIKHWCDKTSLDSMSLPQSHIFLVESVDSINHLLDQLHLAVSQPVLVGDVVGDPSLASRFSTGSTRLKVKFLASSSQNLRS